MNQSEIQGIVASVVNITEELYTEIRKIFEETDSAALGKELEMGADEEPTTQIDKFAEDFLVKKITEKLDCKIISEEMGTKSFGSKSTISLIVDPIDGTKNAVKKSPLFSCSIAILEDGKLIAGVVRDLYNNDVFYAIKGKGALYNQHLLSRKNQFSENQISVILSRPVSNRDFERFRDITKKVSEFRVFGCPSLEICYVASRKFRAAIQIHEKPNGTMMDISAAKIILEEAGGKLLNEKLQEITVVEDPKRKLNFVATLDDDAQIRNLFESNLDDQ